jgi:large subunit ribosomal protein L29
MATANELRELTPEDLDARVLELRRQMFEMRNKHSTGVLDSTADLLKARRDVARCLTVKGEKAMGLERKAREAPGKAQGDAEKKAAEKKPAAEKKASAEKKAPEKARAKAKKE